MNKKGFTLVELITTFSLASALIVILVNIVLIIKDIYIKYEIKTELLIKQGQLYNAVYDEINKNTATDNPTEYVITIIDSSPNYLLQSDSTFGGVYVTEKLIRVGDFSYKAPKGVTFESGLDEIQGTTYKKFYIRITHSLYKNQDFGINLVVRGS